MRSVLAGLAIVALAACSSPSDSTWTFSGRVDNLLQTPEQTSAPRLAIIAPGVLTVRGFVTTPCWNDQVTLDGNRSGNRLTVQIERDPEEPCTDTRVRTHEYLALFASLNRGTFDVTITNRIDNPQGVVHFEGTATIE
jgi:hypothetical protein